MLRPRPFKLIAGNMHKAWAMPLLFLATCFLAACSGPMGDEQKQQDTLDVGSDAADTTPSPSDTGAQDTATASDTTVERDFGVEAPLQPSGIRGIVTGLDLQPIAGAVVRVVTLEGAEVKQVTTSTDGRYDTEVERVGPAILVIEADGFLEGFERLQLKEGVSNTTKTLLKKLAPAVSLADAQTGGRVATSTGAVIEIPAASLVNHAGQSVSGPVHVHLTPLAPQRADELAAHPADLVGRLPDRTSVSLAVFSTLDITITDAQGARLDVAAGKTLRAILPYPSQGAPPEQMNAYSFNEHRALWDQQGRASFDPVERTFQISLPHLSYWSVAEIFRDDTCIETTILDAQGVPVQGAQVTAVVAQRTAQDTSGFYFSTHTDAEGGFATGWKKLTDGALHITLPSGEVKVRPFTAGTGGVGDVPPIYGRTECLPIEAIALGDVAQCDTTLCDDGNECTTEVCGLRGCKSIFAPLGQACATGTCNGQGQCQASCTEECCENAACNDSDGCTIDYCDLSTNTCVHERCAGTTVRFNDFSTSLTGRMTADAATPLTFPIPLAQGGQIDVEFYRETGTGDIRAYSPPSSHDGSFDSHTIPGARFEWSGTFPYIDLIKGGPSNRVKGDITFDFGDKADVLAGADHRYVVGIGGTSGIAGFDEGPTRITASQPLTPIGNFDAFGTGQYATFVGPSTLSGTRSDTTDGLSFFALPEDATSVTFAIDDNPDGTSGAADQHGYVVGVIDLNFAVCDSVANACLGNVCGDGIVRDGEACDDGNLRNGDGCSRICQIEAGASCTDSVKSVCNPPCRSDNDCDDQKGCTANSCNIATGACVFDLQCDTGNVVWNDLTNYTGATAGAWPATIPLPTPTPINIQLSRTANVGLGKFTHLPARGHDASFDSEVIDGVTFGWQGKFDYVEMFSPFPVSGPDDVVNVDFQQPATSIGAGWYYIFGVTALGSGTQGPMNLTSSEPLQSVGHLDVWTPPGTDDPRVSYDPATRTIIGPNGGPNTALEFFLVPQNTSQLDLTLELQSQDIDSFGIWFGAVNLGQKCSADNAGGMCIENGSLCGDGIKASTEACDDGNTADGDGCSATCAVESGYDCQTDVLTTRCVVACQTECCADSDCNDQKGCTSDSCDLSTGTCVYTQDCDNGQVVWNDLSGFSRATTWPVNIPLPTPTPINVELSRQTNILVDKFSQLPARGHDASFTSSVVPGVTFGWQGRFDYINIWTPNPTTGPEDVVTVDFNQPATTIGSGWYYIFGVTALGWPNQGPLAVQSSEPLQYIGHVDVWTSGSDPRVTYDADTRTLTGPTNGYNTALEFFLVSQSASQIQLTLDLLAAQHDGFGIWFGAVNLSEQCSANNAAGMCVQSGDSCGDGIKIASEVCDDGNTTAGDGCSASCTVETGFTCVTDVLTTRCSAN